MKPFEIFELPRSFEIDEKKLDTKYYEITRNLHPDRFSAAQFKLKSLESSALLNSAYKQLKDPLLRIELLLEETGHKNDEKKTSSPTDFDLAEEFFELQEKVLMGDDTSPNEARNQIQAFSEKISSKSQKVKEELFSKAREQNWENPSSEKTSSILKLRDQLSYLSSLQNNIDAMAKKIGVES